MVGHTDIAMRVPGMPDRVRLPMGGTVSEAEARARGLRVVTKAEADAEAAQAARDARVEQFVSLPEAAGKVRSASRLAHDNPGMTPEQGRRFLTGAPSDAAITAQNQAQRQPQGNATPTAAAPADPRAARLDEIRRLGKRR